MCLLKTWVQKVDFSVFPETAMVKSGWVGALEQDTICKQIKSLHKKYPNFE